MESQLITEKQILPSFFTDDIYLVEEPEVSFDKIVQIENDTVKESTVNSPESIYQEKPVHEFKFLGANKRNILILVNDEENEVSDEKGRELLKKIIKSINLTANDFALLNYAGYKNTSFEQLKDYFSSIVILVFGVAPQDLGLDPYQENIMVTEGLVKLIFSADLKKLENDQDAKKTLWSSVKQLEL